MAVKFLNSITLPVGTPTAGKVWTATDVLGNAGWTTPSAGGTGITRSVNSISTVTTAAAVAATDYVYLCNGTFNLTLPSATANTNLYTIKNVGAGVITIVGTVDGGANPTLTTQYQAIDLISDGTAWNVI